MMLRYICLIGVLVFTFQTTNGAPTKASNQLGFKDWLGQGGKSTIGLIDPAKLTVRHSMSFGVVSGDGQSVMQSLYMASFGYKLSDPLTLTLLMGIQDSRFSGQPGYPQSYSALLGGVALDWRPSDNFHLHMEMLQIPGYYINNGYGGAGLFVPSVDK